MAAQAPFRANFEHRVIKQQFDIHNSRLRDLDKNSNNINVLPALTIPFLARHKLIATV